MKTAIRDASGKVLGYKVQRGNQTVVENASGRMVGRYDGNVKKTLDKSGRVLYDGDQTSALIEI